MEEVISGHTKGGSRYKQSKIKDIFPSHMSKNQIKNACRSCKRIQTQGNRVKVRGLSSGLNIEMWVNTRTKEIETANPIK